MRPIHAILPLGTAILLSVMFWSRLWGGGGFIGGDTYTYFMPQKVWYSDRLQAGEFPLWNSLAGHGYPLVAESQTGAFYPLNVVLYRCLDVNSAYSISHLAHYIGTFFVGYLLARRLRLSALSSLLASLIFTYGWFPPRACLEWAIIGGLYFVWGLWCVESYLQLGAKRYLLLLSAGLGLHLLAGHYNLAFITLLTLTAYVPARLWYAKDWLADSVMSHRGRVCGELLASVVLGFALAAVQLWPTWELKQLSQRLNVGATHDTGYGHIPPLYLSQVIMPWMWYSPDVDTEKAIQGLKSFAISSGTNKIEAHLYFGLAPWLVLSWLAVRRIALATNAERRMWLVWIGLSLIAVFFTTGWMLPVTNHLPGFSFFAGPGRYGIVATLGIALVVGAAFDRIAARFRSQFTRGALFAVVFSTTAFDLWIVSSLVTNAFPLWFPPLHHRHESTVCRILREYKQPTRMLAPGQNLPTLTGFSATPQYLGIGPREYFDPNLKMPLEPDDPLDRAAIEKTVAWLRRAGVTHLLRFEPLKSSAWPVRPIWRGNDPLLHPAWARSPEEPLYLYELKGTRGRASFADPESHATDSVEVTDYQANRVTLKANSANGGEVILTDLFYPGWEVTVDGQLADPHRIEEMYRGVTVPAGEHTIEWRFKPKSIVRGTLVSIFAFVLWSFVAITFCRTTLQS